jgi:hypothetical protein
MRGLRAIVGLIATGVFVAQVAQAKTPAFVRQTGLVCNQCHVTWGPTPDFTYTGMKFRMNGYRTPLVADKIEAGKEGAMNGRRLVLGLQNYWNLHYRSNLLFQSKGASDPALPEPAARAVGLQPFTSVGLDYAGIIGENFGIWTEYYFASGNGIGNANNVNFVGNDEYDLRYVFNPGGNIVGMFLSTQPIYYTLWGNFNSGVQNSFENSNVAGTNAHAPHATLGYYGLIRDRVVFGMAAEPGEDNLDFKRMNWIGMAGFLPFTSDANYLWVTLSVKAGNDQVPAVSSLALAPGTNDIVTNNALRGASALRSGGQPYASINTGDAKHFMLDAHGGFLDRGHHSMAYAVGAAFDNETYDDGAKFASTGIGGTVRYQYDRTYGVNFGLSKRLSPSFTDPSGVEHPIPGDLGYDVRFSYRPAMNFAWEFGFSNAQALVLDQNWRNGWNWSLQWHFLY